MSRKSYIHQASFSSFILITSFLSHFLANSHYTPSNDQVFHSSRNNSILVLIHFSLLSPSMPRNGQLGNILALLGGRLGIIIFCICIWYLIHLLNLIISSLVFVYVLDNELIFCKRLPSHWSRAVFH